MIQGLVDGITGIGGEELDEQMLKLIGTLLSERKGSTLRANQWKCEGSC